MPDEHPLDFFEQENDLSKQSSVVVTYLLIGLFCVVNPILWMLLDNGSYTILDIMAGFVGHAFGVSLVSFAIYVFTLIVGILITLPLVHLHKKWKKKWIKTLHDVLESIPLLIVQTLGFGGIVLCCNIILFLILLIEGIGEYTLLFSIN